VDIKTLLVKTLYRWPSHWLATLNSFFLGYALLPVLAPVLLVTGHRQIAQAIYWFYSHLCHQLPSHSYFIFGAQVAICQRCLAMYGMMFLFGLAYSLRRRQIWPLPFRWYLLLLMPLGLDGGLQLVSELVKIAPWLLYWLWGLGLGLIALLIVLLRRTLTWQGLLFLAAGPLALVYVQSLGFYESDWLRRTLTGTVFALGTVWLIYPQLEEGFTEPRSSE
jgi:uncharacterized membrane protein